MQGSVNRQWCAVSIAVIDMKKQKDAGLQYLIELGIRPAKDKNGVYLQLQERLGKGPADELKKELWGETDAQRIYDIKNADWKTAVTFSGAYDGDFYRQACNWLGAHKEQFGQEILEVGCDCGIISCFLGRLLPQAHITAIDRTQTAIAAAEQLAERLQVKNVTFLCTDLHDLAAGQFDTVLSMRTMHENIADRNIHPSFLLLLEQAQLYGNAVAEYAERLMDRVRQGGNLISIEKGEKNPAFLGWLLNLHANGLTVLEQDYTELQCRMVGCDVSFQATIAEKQNVQSQNVYAFWCSLFPVDPDGYQFHGWAAETVLQNMTQDLQQLLTGAMIYNQAGEACGKYAAWTLKSRPDVVLYYQGSADGTTLSLYEGSLQQAICQQIDTVLQQCRMQGLTVALLPQSGQS